MAVANFSRDIAPGSDIRNLTLLTVDAMSSAGTALAAASRTRQVARLRPVNGKINVGGGLEAGAESASNLNPIKPHSGGPSRGIPNHVRAGFEQIAEVFEPASARLIFSNRLRFGDVNWTAAAKGAAKVAAPGGRLSLNVWASPEEAQIVAQAFRAAGFKDVKVLGEGTATIIMRVW